MGSMQLQETIIKTYLLAEDSALRKKLERRLHAVANSYYTYYSQMQGELFGDFHGLRDFYALVKSIGSQKRLVSHNFGALISTFAVVVSCLYSNTRTIVC